MFIQKGGSYMQERIKEFILEQMRLFSKGKITLPLELNPMYPLKKIVVKLKNNFLDDSRVLYFPIYLELRYLMDETELIDRYEAVVSVSLEKEEERFEILSIESRNKEQYSRLLATNYANYYWNKRNPDFVSFDSNCTNFVSQCLLEGGMKMAYTTNQSTGWWYKMSSNYSYSWSVSRSLYLYLINKTSGVRGIEVSSANELEVGDLLFISFKGNTIEHAAIVVGHDINGEPLVNANTADSYYRYWKYTNSSAYTDKIKYYFVKIIDD